MDGDNELRAIKCQCGDAHTLLLTDTHLVMAWGGGDSIGDGHEWDHLGHGTEETKFRPKVIELLRYLHVIDIAAGLDHSLSATTDGNVYSWGDGHGGNLGHGDQENQSTPRRIEYFSDNGIKAISVCGGAFHSAVISSSNELYLFGNKKLIPTKLNIPNVGQVAIGEDCIAMIVQK